MIAKSAANDDPGHSWVAIAPMRMQLLESYHACLGQVCREGRYLMSSCSPDIEKSHKFVQQILDDGMPMFVALIPGMQVVGWCDVYRLPYERQAHVGRLGMGIRADYREQGIGTLLMERALKKALLAGIERVELEVFSSNTRAMNLYRKFGFEVEGTRRRALKVNGEYEDLITMARFLPATPPREAVIPMRKQAVQ